MTISKAYAQFAKAAAYQRRNLFKNLSFEMTPSRLTLLGIALLAFVGVSLLAGCGGSGGSGIMLEVIPNTSQTVDQGQNISFNAIVSPDPNNKGVTWMTPTGSGCAGAGCGTLTNSRQLPSLILLRPIVQFPLALLKSGSERKFGRYKYNHHHRRFTSRLCDPRSSASKRVEWRELQRAGSRDGWSRNVNLHRGLSEPGPDELPPAGIDLESSGVLIGTPTTPGTYTFFVKVTDRGGIQQPNQPPPLSATSSLFTVIINPSAPLSVTTTSVHPGNVNQTYSASLAAKGGVTQYTWSITSGSLPPGLGLDKSTGVISGTPTTVGSFPFVATVQDSSVPPQTAASGTLVISIESPQPLQAITAALPPGMTATPYLASLTAIGGVQPYTWSVISGQLPAG